MSVQEQGTNTRRNTCGKDSYSIHVYEPRHAKTCHTLSVSRVMRKRAIRGQSAASCENVPYAVSVTSECYKVEVSWSHQRILFMSYPDRRWHKTHFRTTWVYSTIGSFVKIICAKQTYTINLSPNKYRFNK